MAKDTIIEIEQRGCGIDFVTTTIGEGLLEIEDRSGACLKEDAWAL